MIVNKNVPVVVKQAVDDSLQKIKTLAKQLWLRIAFFTLIVLVLTQKEFSFQFTIGNANTQQTAGIVETPAQAQIPESTTAPYATTVASNKNSKDKKWWEIIREESKDIRANMNLANAATAVGSALTEEQKKKAAQYSNLGFVLNPNYAKKHNIDPQIVAALESKQWASSVIVVGQSTFCPCLLVKLRVVKLMLPYVPSAKVTRVCRPSVSFKKLVRSSVGT